MSDYIVSPQANQDVFLIWRYLAKHASLETANRVETEIYQAFESLSGKGASCFSAPLTGMVSFHFQVYPDDHRVLRSYLYTANRLRIGVIFAQAFKAVPRR
jgi:plasmid stabilization system protein ParE